MEYYVRFEPSIQSLLKHCCSEVSCWGSIAIRPARLEVQQNWGRQARMQRSSTYCISEHCFKSRNGKRVACRCARSILAQNGGAAYKPRSIEVPRTLVRASSPIKPRFDSDVSASVQQMAFRLHVMQLQSCTLIWGPGIASAYAHLITSTSGSQPRCG
jgi:hypothetical protein